MNEERGVQQLLFLRRIICLSALHIIPKKQIWDPQKDIFDIWTPVCRRTPSKIRP